MNSVFHRYRNIIVLLIVIFAQLILLAWQTKSDNDVPMVRVWAVTAVAPVASTIEGLRNATTGFFSNYFELRNARAQSRQLRTEVERLRVENQLLKNDLASAQRAESLAGFQAHNPSKMIGARVIGATPGMGTRSVLIDRGTQSGVRRGMAVVTPDGIVGTVIAAFPFDSQVRSITDPGFAAGVESQKNHIHGVLKGLGTSSARVDFVPTGQKIEVGEMFFTSGEDRVFPKGLPAGRVTSVREGTSNQEITVEPSGTEVAPEEVLVILDPVHQAVPESASGDAPVFLAPDIGPSGQAQQTGGTGVTTADKLRDEYKKIGDAQKHVFGVGEPGTLPPNFNLKVPGVNAPAAPATPSPGSPDKKAGDGAKPTVPPTPARPQPANATPPAIKSPVPGVSTTAAPATPSPGSPDKKAGDGAKPTVPLTPARPQPANATPPAIKSPAPEVSTTAVPATPSPGSPDKKAGDGAKPTVPLTPARPQPTNATPPAIKSPAPPAREEPRP